MSLLAAKCGLRIGEICGLTWNDINENKCLINVNKQWKKLKNGSYGFGELKSSNSKRTVPVSSQVISELIKFKKEFPVDINGKIFSNIASSSISSSLRKTYC